MDLKLRFSASSGNPLPPDLCPLCSTTAPASTSHVVCRRAARRLRHARRAPLELTVHSRSHLHVEPLPAACHARHCPLAARPETGRHGQSAMLPEEGDGVFLKNPLFFVDLEPAAHGLFYI